MGVKRIDSQWAPCVYTCKYVALMFLRLWKQYDEVHWPYFERCPSTFSRLSVQYDQYQCTFDNETGCLPAISIWGMLHIIGLYLYRLRELSMHSRTFYHRLNLMTSLACSKICPVRTEFAPRWFAEYCRPSIYNKAVTPVAWISLFTPSPYCSMLLFNYGNNITIGKSANTFQI